jgi:DNA invertase Pin-like site-specific DNA recombinase
MMVGYARVSTEQQDTEAQLPDLRKAGCKRIYEETIGGGVKDRPELDRCLERLEKGDTLVVWRLDRLGRSLRDLLQIVDRLDKSGINFISLKERFDTSTAAGRLVFHFFAALTQFEKELIRERTMAGLSSARARGRMGGRKRLLTAQQARVVKTMWDSREHTRLEIAAHFTVSVATIDRVLRAARIVAASRGGK